MADHSQIVVGVDGSDSSKAAVAWAADSAAARGTTLRLVSAALAPLPFAGMAAVGQDFYDDLEAESRRLLDEARTIALERAPDLVVEASLHAGQPVPVLLDWSERAALVVLGSRGRGEFTGAVLGSVADALATHGSCPVVVIRGAVTEPGNGPVVVGVDGSANSGPAIGAAFTEASLRGSTLVAAFAASDHAVDRFLNVVHEPDTALDSVREALAAALAGWEEKFPDVAVERVVAKDRPVQLLLDQAGTAQLVVVGSRGRGGFRGMLLGSTSRALLHGVECPLMIVRDRR
ncbi:universal stress protein [Rhodococcus spelaei]|uniref:Universal stress protein n=1 Tax=Rhodococcus spelaei TaxID=2546320 RepID=A0A541B488_9NOCA|nr:universal stress protein [Rhodococcus spelaei]TQF67132.1 universal stress protein [Rhodococcus spelaei]